MSLRFALVLLTALSYVAIGTALVFRLGGGEDVAEDPPFFYTLDPDDMRRISIETGGEQLSWSLREGTRRWFFDDREDIPADLFRWGGITQLLGGPRTQRVLQEQIEDPALYGLDDPRTRITVTLRDGESISLHLGKLTPDASSHYAKVEGYSQLVIVDATWGQVIERLVTEPPLPEWVYTMTPESVREVLMFIDNDVVAAYSHNRETGEWTVCDIPLVEDPCRGSQPADAEELNAAMAHFGSPVIHGAEALDLETQEDFRPYDADRNSPYIAVRVEKEQPSGVTEVTRVTMTIGGVTPDGTQRYAVANETSDVIRVDKEWADRVLELFDTTLVAS